MNDLILKRFTLGPLDNNTYLVYSPSSRQAFLVDAPSDSEKIKEFIDQQELKLLFILLTHAHFDHIAGLNEWDVPFYLSAKDLTLLDDERYNGSFLFGSHVLVKRRPLFFNENLTLKFGLNQIKVIHTPGHTPGSVCFQIAEWLFSGDTLFFGSVGRTDFPLSSHQDLIDSINNKLLKLADSINVYPGHGPETTIAREKKHNPFLK